MYKLLSTVLFLTVCFSSIAQILHSESFSVIIDTTKTVKGSIVPDFKFQNLKEDLLEIENVSDITYRFRKNAITFANKIELARFGKESILSGGFIYMEYRRIMENKFVLEPYSQLQWAEARGLSLKYAGGAHLRYRIRVNDKMGLFAGSGPFYEYERWTYKGVREENLPDITSTIIREEAKLGSYLSFKWFTDFKVDLDVSLYHQAAFDQLFSKARLASSTSLKYHFTEHLGLVLRYQNIFDPEPVVPIDKLYNKVVFTINVSF